jgi:hypothetical protein
MFTFVGSSLFIDVSLNVESTKVVICSGDKLSIHLSNSMSSIGGKLL